MIEVSDHWAPKPLDSEVFAGARRAIVESWLAAIPRCRLQLVKRPQAAVGGFSLFLGSSVPANEWLARVDFADLDSLFEADVPGLFRERGGSSADVVDSMVLVCTHGKRDRCCAKFGMALFNAAAKVSDAVWQTTHLGGHRFAATALVLPVGMSYGRLQPEDARTWLDAEAQGEIFDLAKTRGRNAYSKHVQAAELLVLEQLGRREHGALRFVAEEAIADGRWRVTFQEGSREISVEVGRDETGDECLGSCGDESPRAVVNLVRAR